MLMFLFLAVIALAGCGGALTANAVSGASTPIIECYTCHEDAACIPQPCDASASIRANSANAGGSVDSPSPDSDGDGGDECKRVESL